MSSNTRWWLLFFCFISFILNAKAFGVSSARATSIQKSTHEHLQLFEDQYNEQYKKVADFDSQNINIERRAFLERVSLAGFAAATTAQSAQAYEEVDPNRDISTGNFDCLLDLPPITPGCVRLYLCRHGQTENNRLRKMQGARVDPEINKNGYEQAERLGMAVGRLIESDSTHAPTSVAHSKLLRAKETSKILADTANNSLLKTKQQSSLQLYGEISSLGEVDFGDLDGKDVNSAKSVMMSTFASWATGDIDKRAGGEGESGREVLNRCVEALETLSKTAAPQGSILAVSHSTYLRILLALVSDSPLAETVLWKINNGSVNVVDVNVEGKRRIVSAKAGLFGGLKKNSDLRLTMPQCYLVRRNEVRHLDGMQL